MFNDLMDKSAPYQSERVRETKMSKGAVNCVEYLIYKFHIKS